MGAARRRSSPHPPRSTRPRRCPSVHGADDRRQRGVDARALLGVDHRAEDLEEARVLHAADDVLPAVGGAASSRGSPAPARSSKARPATCTKYSASALACTWQMPSTAPTSPISSSTALSRCARVELARPRAATPSRRGSRAAIPPSSGTGTRPSTADRSASRGRCCCGSAPARTARCRRSAPSTAQVEAASTACATSLGCGRKR